jgi:hypothetical protein
VTDVRGPTLRQKVAYRLWGLPRGVRELNAVTLTLGTMRRIGWMRSVRSGSPVAADGGPLPWWTYAVIEWLATVLRGDERVLEFGAGNSTLWLAARVADVTAVEHDERWSRRIASLGLPNVTVLFRSSSAGIVSQGSDPYIGVLVELPRSRFDVIVVDGVARDRCLAAVPDLLATGGIVLLDNADRPDLGPSIESLEASGFHRLDFVGPVPGGTNMSCTSVFMRELGERWFRPHAMPTRWGSQIPDFGVL